MHEEHLDLDDALRRLSNVASHVVTTAFGGGKDVQKCGAPSHAAAVTRRPAAHNSWMALRIDVTSELPTDPRAHSFRPAYRLYILAWNGRSTRRPKLSALDRLV